jgi:hypothetical protein
MNTQRIVTHDLYTENDSIIFDKRRVNHLAKAVPELVALSIITTKEGLPRDLELMDKICVENATPLLFANPWLGSNHRLWLFAAHEPWQPKSRIIRYKKLWKSFLSKWDLSVFRLSDEIMIESDEGIRFAGVAEVPETGFFTAAKILLENPSCALILSEREDINLENGIMNLFNAAFCPPDRKPQVGIDWLSLALDCCSQKDIVIRVVDSWDERIALINMIMPLEKLKLFEKLE